MKKLQYNVLLAVMAFATQDASASGLLDGVQNLVGKYGQVAQTAAASAFQQGVATYKKTGNFKDVASQVASGAQQGFQQGNLKKQADELILEFFDEQEMPTTTVAQKKAIQNLYNSQEYQQIIDVIKQTNDIYIMLSKTSDKVKNDNQATLMQMGDAIQKVDDSNIALVTQKIHDFVSGIAPAGSGQIQSDVLSKAEVEAIVIGVIQENYGDLLQWVQQAMERERLQRNSQTNNPFLPSNVGTKNSSQGQQTNNPFMSNQPIQQQSRSGSSAMPSGQNTSSMQTQTMQQSSKGGAPSVAQASQIGMTPQSSPSTMVKNNQR